MDGVYREGRSWLPMESILRSREPRTRETHTPYKISFSKLTVKPARHAADAVVSVHLLALYLGRRSRWPPHASQSNSTCIILGCGMHASTVHRRACLLHQLNLIFNFNGSLSCSPFLFERFFDIQAIRQRDKAYDVFSRLCCPTRRVRWSCTRTVGCNMLLNRPPPYSAIREI